MARWPTQNPTKKISLQLESLIFLLLLLLFVYLTHYTAELGAEAVPIIIQQQLFWGSVICSKANNYLTWLPALNSLASCPSVISCVQRVFKNTRTSSSSSLSFSLPKVFFFSFFYSLFRRFTILFSLPFWGVFFTKIVKE